MLSNRPLNYTDLWELNNGRGKFPTININRRLIMSNAKMLVDFIQSSKKQFVNDVFADEIEIKDGMNKFVDEQTKLTKTIIDNYTNFNRIIFNRMIKG
jgi:hypothetical protein